jgi:hypothetical protein
VNFVRADLSILKVIGDVCLVQGSGRPDALLMPPSPRYRKQKKQYKGHLQRIENKRVTPMAG